jgi:hypothetical protein
MQIASISRKLFLWRLRTWGQKIREKGITGRICTSPVVGLVLGFWPKPFFQPPKALSKQISKQVSIRTRCGCLVVYAESPQGQDAAEIDQNIPEIR